MEIKNSRLTQKEMKKFMFESVFSILFLTTTYILYCVVLPIILSK